MDKTSELNLFDVDLLIKDFLERYSKGLSTLHKMNYSNNDKLSFMAFVSELTNALRTACVTFINNHEFDYRVIGAGSNLLIPDQG